MGLSLTLSNALTGLRASQSAFGVLSHNIANANNPNHTRQIVTQSSVYVEGVGSGVQVEDVLRNIDTFLRRSILNQNSIVEDSRVVNDFHNRIQVLLGSPGSENTLDDTLTTFYNTLSLLSETPERSSFRSNAVNSAIDVARQVSDLAFRLEDLRFQADRQLSESVRTTNNVLRRLEQVNVAITSASLTGLSRAGLEDERDALLRDLSEKIDITAFFDENGAVNVNTANGLSLLDNSSRRELSYSAASSVATFSEDTNLRPLTLTTINRDGTRFETTTDLITAGTRDNITSIINGGEIHGLQRLRDEIIPDILAQLDTLASAVRDTINAAHNLGTAFPPPAALTGTRAVLPGDAFNWTGSVRIAALQANGEPVNAVYNDETTGFRPLTLNLANLDTGSGKGRPSIQGIVNEINNQFRIPPAKAVVGNLNNVQIVSTQSRLPTSPVSQFTFDFDLENISDGRADLFYTGVTVRDAGGVDITAVSQDIPRQAVDAANTYTTTPGSRDVVVQTVLPHGVSVGDTIYLSTPPGGPFNGIPAAELGGYFVVKDATAGTVTIEVGTPAVAGPPAAAAGVTLSVPYSHADAGTKARTVDDGSVTVDLSGNITSAYYDITVDVGVLEEDGTLTTATITYRVPNNEQNIYNKRYDTTAVSGSGTRVLPNTTQQVLRAILVDENGVELPKQNGEYIPDVPGFLKIVGVNGSRVAIEDLGSQQLGKLENQPIEPGTGRGFSHFFELNNLFTSNAPTATGDLLRGSAFNLALEDRLLDDPNLIATSRLERSRQPTDPDAFPDYTYTLYSGNNSNAQALFATSATAIRFAAAGGLPETELSLAGYVGEFLGFTASQSAAAETVYATSESLLNGFQERSQAISSVNLDEELANTIIYQNSYTAAARVISLVDELFADLLQVIQ